jgi:aryl-alcohol dehydrogenase-like predicted oxidoreductase
LIGASKVSQIEEIVGALANPAFAEEELAAIEAVLADSLKGD